MRRANTKLPPGPSGWPWVGSGPRFARDPLGFLVEVARDHGDLASARFGARTLVWLSHPRLIEEVFAGRHRDCLTDRPTRELLPVLGEGLLTNAVEPGPTRRELAASRFQPKRMESYAAGIAECTEQVAAGLRENELRNIHADVMQLTLEITGKTLLGFDVRCEGARVSAALEAVFADFAQLLHSPAGLVSPYLSVPARARLERAKASLTALITQLAQRAQRNPDGPYLLAQWASDTALTVRRLCDEAITLLLAGHETAALTISYALYALSENPACQLRVRAELDALGARTLGADDLPKLPYLDAVVRESLRLYPPAWLVTREVSKAFVLAGYELPAGVELACSPYALQRDPRFFREPERFLPERWLDTGRAAPPRYAYIPFGAEARACIGTQFARREALLVLGTLLQQVRLQVVPGYRLELLPAITMRPRNGLPVIVQRVRPRGRPARPRAGVAQV